MTTAPAPDRLEEDAGGGISLVRLWAAVRKHWLLVAATAVATLVASAFYTLGQKKIYASSVTVQIEPNPPRPLGNEVQTVVEMGTGAYWSNKEYYQTQFKIIQSRRVAEETARSLGLHRDGAFLANLPPGASAPAADVAIAQAANVLRGRLQVEPVKDSRLVTVTVEDANPARAQRVVTALVNTYLEQNLDDVLTSTTSATDWLRGQLGKLKKELEGSEMALHDYKKDKQILSVSIDDQSNMLREEMQQLNAALIKVRTDLEQIKSRHDELAKVSAKDPTNLPATELLSSALLQRLRENYIDAKRQYDSLVAAGKGANHPDVKSAGARITTSREALLSEVHNIQGAVERDLAAAKQQEAGLGRLFENAKKRALDLNLLEIEYNRLLREKTNTEKLYSVVLERTKESDLTRFMRFNNLHVVDRALVPNTPVRPRLSLGLAVGAFAGLALGLGLALGRDFLDRSIKTPEQLERELRLAFLGLIPAGNQNTASNGYGYGYRARNRDRQNASPSSPHELIVHEQPTSGIAEAARAIRTNILFMAPDNPHRRLLVTSAAPAEGKTTVACCLAIAMAQAGQRVLLLDADLRRPRLHRIFGRTNAFGVSSALLDPSVLDRVTLETAVPNLSLLAAGPHVPNPSELLQSESFGRLLDSLSQSYDRIVIDSSPVVPVTDAVILSTKVDGVVLVVRAFKTSREIAQQARRALVDVGGRLIGAVLNAVDLTRGDYGYRYYQAYGYAQKADPAGAPVEAKSKDHIA
ncbi:MAG TPA: polysaccharide biosynthesis tyrosine autokinase [Polyangiaceae bacterium]|jgi:capsular exopolysaccharide synthesis family protein